MVDKSDMGSGVSSSEQAILIAAERIFVARGYDGARMQEIADAAGINKAMLHYYFRSKDRLFDAVFKSIIQRALPPLLEGLGSDLPLGLKIRKFVKSYLEILSRHPETARFVLHELHRRPGNAESIIRLQAEPMRQALARQLEEAASSGRIRPVAPESLIIDLLSLCVFPVVARPFLEALCGADSAEYDRLVADRADAVTAMVFASMQPAANNS